MIDQFSDEPFYRQLARILGGQIKDGELTHLAMLPSETTLEQEYGVSRSTIRRAMALLREEGLIFTVAHRGSYVGPRPGQEG